MDEINRAAQSQNSVFFSDNAHFVNNKFMNMMAKMGYGSGSDFGSVQEDPAPLDVQSNGSSREFDHCQQFHEVGWDFNSEAVDYKEHVSWLTSINPIWYSDLSSWIIKGSAITDVERETAFCDKNLIKDILKAKNIFEILDEKALYHARARANPFETIYSACFMNRAALKMANIDRATDFMFTAIDHNPCHQKTHGAYYFADVCGGPGGFSEYVLWRRHWLFKGFGFTLRGKHDFKLENSKCSSDVTFNTHYGARDDGNIFYPENIHSFAEAIAQETDGLGVHFMMSDGGFSVEGREHLQEVLSKQLYVCQCYTALQILRPHGHFVTKVFDLFTSFSVGLVFLMYNCFEKVTILKPNTSRPANSERYLICYGLKTHSFVDKVKQHLLNVITILEENRTNNDNSLDVIEIVPMSIIMQDEEFYRYMVQSNDRIGRNQIIALHKLAAFCRNPYLVETRQDELKENCLQHWQIPAYKIQPIFSIFTSDNLSELLTERECLSSDAAIVKSQSELLALYFDTKNWHYVPSTSTNQTNTCSIFAAVNRTKVFRLTHSWVKVKKMKLFCGTVLYGEIVTELIVLKSDPGVVEERKCLHVIDAIRLGCCDISHLSFAERQNLISVYCDAVNHESRTNVTRIRPKPVNILQTVNDKPIITYDEYQKMYLCSLPILGKNSLSEYYHVNSILLCETNYGVTFDAMFKARFLILLKAENSRHENYSSEVTLNSLINYVRDLR